MTERDNRTYTVYKHTTPSGKVYIGITIETVVKRWKNGRGYEGCTAFERAIKKYGWKNIKHEILKTGLNKETACAEERRLIKQYDSANPEHGYNLTLGGDHYEMNAEMRERVSVAQKKRFANRPEDREHLSRIQRGRKMSAESSEKKRRAMIEYIEKHPERREKCRETFKGVKRSEEFCRKLGERKSKPVICKTTGQRFKSITEATKIMNVPPGGISATLSGRAKTCGGYEWEYAK